MDPSNKVPCTAAFGIFSGLTNIETQPKSRVSENPPVAVYPIHKDDGDVRLGSPDTSDTMASGSGTEPYNPLPKPSGESSQSNRTGTGDNTATLAGYSLSVTGETFDMGSFPFVNSSILFLPDGDGTEATVRYSTCAPNDNLQHSGTLQDLEAKEGKDYAIIDLTGEGRG